MELLNPFLYLNQREFVNLGNLYNKMSYIFT